MSTYSTPRLSLPDTSALDDVTAEDDALTAAWSSAVARAIGKAEREERRSQRIRAAVTAKRTTTDYAYAPIPEEIQAFLTANPAF